MELLKNIFFFNFSNCFWPMAQLLWIKQKLQQISCNFHFPIFRPYLDQDLGREKEMKMEKLGDLAIQDHWIIYLFNIHFLFPHEILDPNRALGNLKLLMGNFQKVFFKKLNSQKLTNKLERRKYYRDENTWTPMNDCVYTSICSPNI